MKKLKPVLFIIAVTVTALIFSACGGSGLFNSSKDNAKVIFSMAGVESRATTASAPSDFSQLSLTVSAEDLEEDITETVDFTAGSSTSVALIVPKGLARTFDVEAKNAGGDLMYAGTVTMDIEEDIVTLIIEMVYKGPGEYDYIVYLANWGADYTFSSGDWDEETGSFSNMTSPVSATDPHGILVHHNGKNAYISTWNDTATAVTNATIDQSTGVLTLGGTSSTGTKPTDIAVHPTLPVAYISAMAVADNRIWVHSINEDGTIGSGTAIAQASDFPHRIFIHPNGEFLYVANEAGSYEVQIFSINQTDGSLTYVADQTSATQGSVSATGVVIHPNGLFAYVTYTGAPDACIRYDVDPDTGLLSSEIELFSETIDTYEAVSVDPFGKYLYITKIFSGQDVFGVYTIDPTTGNTTFKENITPPGDYYLHTNVEVGRITIRAAGTE